MQSRTAAAVALAALAFLIYNANLRPIASGDTVAARYLPLAIRKSGTTQLDSLMTEMDQIRAPKYWLFPARGHQYSAYPIVTPVVLTPLYAPAAAYLSYVHDWQPDAVERVSGVMEKLSAALIAAVSVAILYLALLRIVRPRTALLLVIAYAFGTNTWMTSSQGLWQHGLGALLLAIVLYAACRAEEHWRWSAIAGVCCALIAFNRPADGLMVVAVSLFFLTRRTWMPFVIAGAAIALPFLLYNLAIYQSVIGGYGHFYIGSHVKSSPSVGFAGVLFSPAKGLFVFSPFLLLLFVASPHRFATAWQKVLAFCLIAGLVAQVILCGRMIWTGGHCFGPRLLAGLVPLMIWLIAPVVDDLTRPKRLIFATLVAFSIGMQLIGAFYYPSSGMDALYERDPWKLWSPAHNTVLRDFRAGRMPMTYAD